MFRNKDLSATAQQLFSDIKKGVAVNTNYILGHLPYPIPLQNIYEMEKDAKGNDFAKRISPIKLLYALRKIAKATDIEDKLIKGTSAYNDIASAKSTLANKKLGFRFGQYSVDMLKTDIDNETMLDAMECALASAIIPVPSNVYHSTSSVFQDEQDFAEKLDNGR